MTSIYEAIRNDHNHHRKLLDIIADTSGDTQKRRKAWMEFYYDVKSHAAAEEETFYSKIMEKEDGQSDARHSVSEHQEMDDLMEELNGTDMSSPAWLARFKTLKHDYEHHMEEEEEDIFKTASAVLVQDGDASIGREFLKRKERERDLVDKKREAALSE